MKRNVVYSLILIYYSNRYSVRGFQSQQFHKKSNLSSKTNMSLNAADTTTNNTTTITTEDKESAVSRCDSPPWYSHPGIERCHVQNKLNTLSDLLTCYQNAEEQQRIQDHKSTGIKFILISSKGMWHENVSATVSSPLYLTTVQLMKILLMTKTISVDDSGNSNSNSNSHNCNNDIINNQDDDSHDYKQHITVNEEHITSYIGKYEDVDYWVVYLKDGNMKEKDDAESHYELKSIMSTPTMFTAGRKIQCKPLREFGDSLENAHDSGIVATANGLIEFHKSHGYCSRCGSPTESTKAGGSRRCTRDTCRTTVYPRIDSATIMLVTSPCENYALLGRKKNWPVGRYSALAGFCEVGETLEECCQRETLEESGVRIDPVSVRFELSQPWPFPRSLMVGFRARAASTTTARSTICNKNTEESSSSSSSSSLEFLPEITIDTNEMEDIRWFHKRFVKERLSLVGSTALSFQPNDDEKEFHIPGKASLARYLITKWAKENR